MTVGTVRLGMVRLGIVLFIGLIIIGRWLPSAMVLGIRWPWGVMMIGLG